MQKINNFLKKKDYIGLFNYLLKDYLNMSENKTKALKELLLFNAIDFLSTIGDKEKEKKNNIFFARNNLQIKIKMIFDTNQDIYYYVYSYINCTKYIEKLLKDHIFYNDIVLDKSRLNKYVDKNNLSTELKILLENGITVYKDFFRKKELKKYKKLALKFLDELNSTNQNDLNKTVSFSPLFVNEGKERLYIDNTENAPKIFSELMNNKRILNIVSSVLGVEAKCATMQVERITYPEFYCDYTYWHIDTIADQLKIMIPLDDILEDGAPLLYLEGTHDINSLSDKLKSLYHFIYKLSDLHTLPTNAIDYQDVVSSGLEQKKAIANAGDLVVFNPTFIHTASQCRNPASHRLNLILIYNYNTLKTNKNRLFRYFKSFYRW